jgi:hypothetical protein
MEYKGIRISCSCLKKEIDSVINKNTVEGIAPIVFFETERTLYGIRRYSSRLKRYSTTARYEGVKWKYCPYCGQKLAHEDK